MRGGAERTERGGKRAARRKQWGGSDRTCWSRTGPERDVDVHRVLLTPTFDRLRLQSAGQAWQVGQLDHLPKRYRVEDCLRDAEQDNVEEVFRADAHRVLGQSEEEHDSANVRIIQRPVQCLFTSWWTRAATYRQCVNNIYLNGQIPASFCLFSSFSH